MKTKFRVFKKDLDKAVAEEKIINATGVRNYERTGPCHCVVAQAVARHFKEPVKSIGVSSATTPTMVIDWYNKDNYYRDVMALFDNDEFDKCRALLPITFECKVMDKNYKPL